MSVKYKAKNNTIVDNNDLQVLLILKTNCTKKFVYECTKILADELNILEYERKMKENNNGS